MFFPPRQFLLDWMFIEISDAQQLPKTTAWKKGLGRLKKGSISTLFTERAAHFMFKQK